MQKKFQSHATCVSNQLSDLIMIIAVKFAKRFERHFDFELSPLQTQLLFHIHLSGPQPISELSLCNKISKQQLTPILHRLIEENYIVKSPNPNDRRSHLVNLTDEGSAFIETVIKESTNIIEKSIQQLSPEDYAALGYHTSALLALMEKIPDADFVIDPK